jgi:error-prone DNA polymerase
VGWRNPPIPWPELERRLSGRPPGRPDGRPAGTPAGRPPHADGGDSPAWSRRRLPYQPPPGQGPRRGRVPYAELHCHSNFSFLDGANHPEELVEEAVGLGLSTLALTDHDGLYGVVRFAEAARALELPTVFGAELTLPDRGAAGESAGNPGAGGKALGGGRAARGVPAGGSGRGRGRASAPSRTGVPDPGGTHLVVLARSPEGYASLSRVIGQAHLAGREKGRPAYDLAALSSACRGQWLVLTGCRKGAVPAALIDAGPAAAARELQQLVGAFGRENVAVELWDHGDPLDSARNDALADLGVRAGVDVVATANAHYATPARRPLATALAAVRARRSLEELDGWLPAGPGAHLRSGAEQAGRFARYPGAVERAAELGRACAFDLALVAPRLPPYPVPAGQSEASYLSVLAAEGATRRYGPRGAERVPGAWAQVDRELLVICGLGFAGYFLVVWDIVEHCRRQGIYCQGRGSAANSAVCFALGITNVDAVALGLLFERFLSPARDGPPDIDVDIESGRREEVIQYVYERYGREHAAQVANVITYRPRSAVRDMGRALGYPPGTLDAWSRQLEPWGPLPGPASREGGPSSTGPSAPVPPASDGTGIPPEVLRLAAQVEGFPRHLGIHSGGMVICDRPVVEVCPVEWARMEGRSVLQWDKDDCAAVGLVKFDLLGLGMLSALHGMVDLVRSWAGTEVDLAALPQEDEVYEMLCRADSVGVFQVESRAQMATLPRLKPRCFYDLVVEVALIRPGPIQGGSVHPYLRRRHGREPVTYPHPLLRPALEKTLGAPLFQEQLMQMAIDVAGFSPTESDQLRQAMGAKRSRERMRRLRARLYEGMAERGITGQAADSVWEKLVAFANFGFPESHSVSFAYLVYASAWFKLHHPAAFLAGLLNAQPMGFWSPATLVADARRHGVSVRRPHVCASEAQATLEPEAGPVTEQVPGRGGSAVRLGLEQVRTIGSELAARIAAGKPYASMEDLVRRGGVQRNQLEALATAGALEGLAPAGEAGRPSGKGGLASRRAALWAAGAVAHARTERLPGVLEGVAAPPLPAMAPIDEAVADLWATGVSPGAHLAQFARPRLAALGATTAADLGQLEPGSRVTVAGVVTHRQRPATARGTVFVNLEDETGLVNVICSQGVWARYRQVARGAAALLVRGRLERADGAVNVVAERLDALTVAASPRSRDFR